MSRTPASKTAAIETTANHFDRKASFEVVIAALLATEVFCGIVFPTTQSLIPGRPEPEISN